MRIKGGKVALICLVLWMNSGFLYAIKPERNPFDPISQNKLAWTPDKKKVKHPLEDFPIVLLQVNYAKAGDLVNLVKDKQNSLLSEKGKMGADGRTNRIWIQDTPKKVEEVKYLIKQLDIPVKQVLIEARLVEVSKNFSQDIGIKWAVSRPPSLRGALSRAGSLESGDQNVMPSLTKLLNLDLIATPARSGSPATVGIALAKISEKILLDLELSALESEGRAELISSPRLIARDQQPALIESGQEIPYQETTPTGATTVAFKKAVLSLKVTPYITPDNKILMDLQINQGSASPLTVNGVPAILTKEIQTNILVNNGQTIVLGGIYIKDKAKTINRVPFLSYLPLIGKLFINKQVNWKNDEMLIFITPKIISSALGTVKQN